MRCQVRCSPSASPWRAGRCPTRTQKCSAARDRQVTRRVEQHSQGSLTFTGPAVDIATVCTALDLRATSRPATTTDARTLDQRRFDAPVDVCREAATSGIRPRRGLAPTVHVYADAATWAGLHNEPAELSGYGPIRAGIARDHFTSSAWRAVVTDALTGLARSVSDATMRRRRAPVAISRLATATARSRPARRRCGSATPTTTRRTLRAGAPTGTTAACSADATTDSRPSPAGYGGDCQTAPRGGQIRTAPPGIVRPSPTRCPTRPTDRCPTPFRCGSNRRDAPAGVGSGRRRRR